MKVELIEFQKHGDNRGALIVLEQQSNIPFDIKRVYYMFGTQKDIRRGYHAHKKLRQVAIPIAGSCKFLLDDGTESVEIKLDNPSKGLMIEPMIWHEMFDYSDNCILLVLADDLYNEDDYIRDYKKFVNEVMQKNVDS